jgi:hypothetical protein
MIEVETQRIAGQPAAGRANWNIAIEERSADPIALAGDLELEGYAELVVLDGSVPESWLDLGVQNEGHCREGEQ